MPRLASALVLLTAMGLVGATYQDYGIAWDEGVQARYGELVLAYFRSGMVDDRANDLFSLRIYGPLLESAMALVYEGTPDRRFEIRHGLTALFGLLALPALALCARPLRRPWLGATAGVFLVTMPRFWGHLFANSKDVPFAAAFSLAMASLAGLLTRTDHPWRLALACGGALGLAGAIRPGGLPLLMLLLAGVLAYRVYSAQRDGTARRGPWIDTTLEGALVVAVAWVLMVAPWPWAHLAPVQHPLRAMLRATALPKAYPVLFDGTVFQSTDLPATYIVEYLAITTPLVTLALAVVGLGFALVHRPATPVDSEAPALHLFAAWLLAPLALFFVVKPNVYDGIRHVLFLLPAIALFAGYGACRLVAAASAQRLRTAAITLIVFALGGTVAQQVALHPYQSSYFNALAGGLRGAQRRYETDYWATSYREALAWIRAHHLGERPIEVLIAANGLAFEGWQDYADEDLRLTKLTPKLAWGPNAPAGFDYYVATYRYGFDILFPDAPILHEVGRDGARFAVVKAGPERQ